MGRSIYGVTVTDKRPAPPEYQVPGTV